MFQKSSFFFGELTPGGTGDVGHCIDQIRERLAPKDGIERRQSLQAPEAAENWWVGEGEIFTWRNYSAYFFRIVVEVFVLVNIYDVVSKLNSVEIAICYLPRFFSPKRQVQRRMSQQQRRATVAELCRPEGLKQLEAKTCPKLEGFWKMRKHPNAFERILLDDQELISDTEIHSEGWDQDNETLLQKQSYGQYVQPIVS